jgi:phosphoglycerate dehydrogenase-like enzyme
MEKPRIVVTLPVGEKRRTIFNEILGKDAHLSFFVDLPADVRKKALAEARVLLSWDPAKELLPEDTGILRSAKLIQLVSAGVDHLPFAALRPDIVIAGNVGAYAKPMAEHALAMVLALAKNLLPQHGHLAAGEFRQMEPNRMLAGSLCGIVGYGGVGRETARLMRLLGLRILAVNTSGRTGDPVEFAGTLADLEHVLSSSDVVVLSLPLTRATRGLIGAPELAWMKPDAILVNVARGPIIDQQAVYEHLKSRPAFRLGLDVWWTEPSGETPFRTDLPFFDLPNVLGSPHNSGIVPGIREEAARRAAENVNRFLRGERVVGVAKREDYL